jgi:hypothetical protein
VTRRLSEGYTLAVKVRKVSTIYVFNACEVWSVHRISNELQLVFNVCSEVDPWENASMKGGSDPGTTPPPLRISEWCYKIILTLLRCYI